MSILEQTFKIDPVAWAAMIDKVSAFNTEDFGSRPAPPSPKPVEAANNFGQAVDKSLEAITAAVNSAATKEDQLVLSCGLPLVFDAATQRYSLAPTAGIALMFQRDNSFRNAPLKVNLGASLLYAKRMAAAAAKAAKAAIPCS